MNPSPRCCVLIPVYRHLKPLLNVLRALEKYKIPCVIIDDCNDPPLAESLAAELKEKPWIDVYRLPQNSGKGVSCIEGSRRAYEREFSHAIFVDADDQHDLGDLPTVVALVNQHPEAMILGTPIFDGSAPLRRRLGRVVSNVWVWIETLSFQIEDSLFGYHCLPLKPVVDIASQVRLGKRMDFDPDILVRLFWSGVPVITFRTHVRYPPGGLSNFHMIRDNLALFRLHSRLVFGLLLRWPSLLRQRWSRA